MPPDSAQLWLLPWENPLRTRLGVDFFRELPDSPGVYLMLSRDAEVLYVGKSRCLRNRVRSYTCVHPHRSSRKICRLVHEIAAIQIQTTVDEPSALRLENELIRHYRPRFNRIATHPESHVFWGIRRIPSGLELRWTRRESELAEWDPTTLILGAFRGPSGLGALAALRRLLWWHQADGTPCAHWPHFLTSDPPIPCTTQPWPTKAEGVRLWRTFERWARTGDPAFLHRLAGRGGLRLQREQDRFTRKLLEHDRTQLERLGLHLSRPEKHLFRHAVRRQGYLRQAQLDDLALANSVSSRADPHS